MCTYEGTKLHAIDTIGVALSGLLTSNDHEANKKFIESIKKAADLMLWLEDLQMAFENKDLDGMHKAKVNNGF